MSVYQEPLDAVLWFKRVELIANGVLGSVENSLRHASHLVAIAPQRLRPLIGLGVDPESFEELLESGDFDTAARHLVARQRALSIEGEAGASLVRATIRCPALDARVHGIGDTIAKAVLNAWTSRLLRLKARYGEELSGLVQRSPADDRQSSVFLLVERSRWRTTVGEETAPKEDPGRT